MRHLAQRCWISSSSPPWHCNQIQFVIKFWLKSDWGPKGRGKFTQYQRRKIPMEKFLQENPYGKISTEIFLRENLCENPYGKTLREKFQQENSCRDFPVGLFVCLFRSAGLRVYPISDYGCPVIRILSSSTERPSLLRVGRQFPQGVASSPHPLFPFLSDSTR